MEDCESDDEQKEAAKPVQSELVNIQDVTMIDTLGLNAQ